MDYFDPILGVHWRASVSTKGDLPMDAEVGDSRMVGDTSMTAGRHYHFYEKGGWLPVSRPDKEKLKDRHAFRLRECLRSISMEMHNALPQQCSTCWAISKVLGQDFGCKAFYVAIGNAARREAAEQAVLLPCAAESQGSTAFSGGVTVPLIPNLTGSLATYTLLAGSRSQSIVQKRLFALQSRAEVHRAAEPILTRCWSHGPGTRVCAPHEGS